MPFVPEGQTDSSQARSAWVATQRGSRPGGTVEVIVSPQTFVVETELMPRQKCQVILSKGSAPIMVDLVLDVINGFRQLRDAHTESAI